MIGRHLSSGILAAALLAAPLPALAERLQPDFTFRRVAVPQSGGNRITVQIDPDAPSAIRAPDTAFPDGVEEAVAAALPPVGSGPAASAGAPRPGGYDWFWLAVSPRLEDGGPGRLELALRALGQAPDGEGPAGPRLAGLQQIATAHGPDILSATVGTGVSPALVLAVISVESAGRIEAVSHAGAQGLMQLMPATAERFAVADALVAGQNIRGGVAYLDWLLGHFDGDPILALAGYNAGEGAVRDHGGVPPYAETRAYVPKVLAAWEVARGLCLTPPVLISDGCVFSVAAL